MRFDKTEVPRDEGTRGLRRVFGTTALIAFGLAYLVPLTVFTTFGTVSKLTSGHLPLAYAVTTVAMLFTAFSYAVLVREMPSAGSAFSFAVRAFGERFGFITGWTLLLDYILLPAINYLIIGIYMHAQLPFIPASAFILGAIALVTILNVMGVDIVRNVSLGLVLFQLVFAAAFVLSALTHVGLAAAEPHIIAMPDIQWFKVFSGAGILCLSFLGFDAISTLSEEARDPRRTVPRAIMLTTVIGGILFMVLAYVSGLLLPNWGAISGHDSAGMDVMAPLGKGMSSFFLLAYISGCVASAITAQASVSRVLFAMGRERDLPEAWFGKLNERYQTPANATITVAFVSLIVLGITLDTIASVISFGALFAFSVVNLAVPRILLVSGRPRGAMDVLFYGFFPLVGFCLTVWLWLSLGEMAILVGAAWMILGVLIALARKAVNPAQVPNNS